MVLHDVTYYSKLVEISSASLGAEGLLERYDDAGDVVSVPNGLKHGVGKSKGKW